MNFTPIFKSRKGDVTFLKYSQGCGSLFAITNSGIVNRIDSFPLNAFGRGLRYVYSQIENGEGDLSDSAFTSVYYDLYKLIMTTNTNESSFTVVKQNVESFSVFKNLKVKALYVSDVLTADEDFGFWKTISWKQSSNASRVIVALKVANTQEELLKLNWQYYISEEAKSLYGSPIPGELNVIKDLDRFNLKGRFMQFKVELETEDKFLIPYIGNFIVIYASKTSVFFFTRKIKIERGSNVDDIILTASYSEPDRTEIRFGIANSNTADWKDYKIITLDELTSLGKNFGNIFKIGIKLSSYSLTAFPVVNEFGFILGSDSDNRLNQ